MGAKLKNIFEQNVRHNNCNQNEPCVRLPYLLTNFSTNLCLHLQSIRYQVLES